jgi:hypothetical protein
LESLHVPSSNSVWRRDILPSDTLKKDTRQK